jgi:hypothetical protein
MELHRQLAKRRLQLLVVGTLLDAERFVKVSLHGFPLRSSLPAWSTDDRQAFSSRCNGAAGRLP